MKYLKYFLYVMEHKWNVLIECWKAGLYWHGITHDLSKLRPSEFFPYARFFHRKDRTNNYKQSDETDPDFLTGWNLHQKRNKHQGNTTMTIGPEYMNQWKYINIFFFIINKSVQTKDTKW